MLSYRMDGPILILTATGAGSTAEERDAIFTAIRNDPAVPDRAPLLIDARGLPDRLSQLTLNERVEAMVLTLGPKLGSVCAALPRDAAHSENVFFQAIGHDLGIRVGIFSDEADARTWLLLHALH